jgi:hypothetical protein
MGERKTFYKSVKISPLSYEKLIAFCERSGKKFIDVVDNIMLFIDNNKITYPQLSRTDTLNPAIEKVAQRIEDLVSIVRAVETGKIDSIIKTLVRVEVDTVKLLSNIEINKNLESEIDADPSVTAPSGEIPGGSIQKSSEYLDIKNEKELIELRVKEAAEFMKIILDKLATTSSGYKRSFSEDEIQFMKKYIQKCTVQ